MLAARGSPAPARGSPDGVNGNLNQADPTQDWQVRQRLLKKNPELNALHVDLVRSGMMSEEEFWEGREVGQDPHILHTLDISDRYDSVPVYASGGGHSDHPSLWS